MLTPSGANVPACETAKSWSKVSLCRSVCAGHGPENEVRRSGQRVAPAQAGKAGEIGVVRKHVRVVFERECG
jgi:hypothetical protein